MSEIFLSASVPLLGRGTYHETADPFLIQCAVRELIISVIGTHKIVWGGHPAITPMVWAVCKDLGVEYSRSVTLYQSGFFSDRYPEENEQFQNVIFVDHIPGDQAASLLLMREEMLSRPNLAAAVFIGGMDGVEEEYEIFSRLSPGKLILPLLAPGGAAKFLAERLFGGEVERLSSVNFSKIYCSELLPFV